MAHEDRYVKCIINVNELVRRVLRGLHDQESCHIQTSWDTSVANFRGSSSGQNVAEHVEVGWKRDRR
jgi:hypothetical protein